MPHISSKKINPLLSEKAFKKFISILGKANEKNYFSLVAEELFTSTEKIMLAKRIAIILLLSDKIPQDRIVNVLKVSPSTVSKMSLKLEIGKYATILQISKKEKFDLEKLVWNRLTVGGIMPPKVGRRYWKNTFKKKT